MSIHRSSVKDLLPYGFCSSGSCSSLNDDLHHDNSGEGGCGDRGPKEELEGGKEREDGGGTDVLI